VKKDDKKTEDKKTEDKKTEDKKPEEPKATDTSKPDDAKNPEPDSSFTPEQDALILRLKAANTSWREIATQMSLAKSDIQQRYKELQKAAHAHQQPTSPDTTPETPKEKDKEAGDKADSGPGAGPGGRRLKADDNWTREDCEILEMLEQRYREEKWMSIQSSFYNWTGRMIIADVIEQKMREDKD
jgi:hypothetical protein